MNLSITFYLLKEKIRLSSVKVRLCQNVTSENKDQRVLLPIMNVTATCSLFVAKKLLSFITHPGKVSVVNCSLQIQADSQMLLPLSPPYTQI